MEIHYAYIYVNIGAGDIRYGYIELMCKGNVLLGSKFRPAERVARDRRLQLYFQKSTLMDRGVMVLSAKTSMTVPKNDWTPKETFCSL